MVSAHLLPRAATATGAVALRRTRAASQLATALSEPANTVGDPPAKAPPARRYPSTSATAACASGWPWGPVDQLTTAAATPSAAFHGPASSQSRIHRRPWAWEAGRVAG